MLLSIHSIITYDLYFIASFIVLLLLRIHLQIAFAILPVGHTYHNEI